MTDEELVKLIQDNQNPKENLLALWEQNRRFAWALAVKYRGYADIDDLMQQAYLGMHKAAYSFYIESGVKFLSYAGTHMHAQMWEHINRCCRAVSIPPKAAEMRRKYLKIQDEIKNKFKRDATDDEICIALDITYEQLDDIRQSFIFDSVKSLDEKPAGENSDDITLSDCVASDQDVEGEVLSRIQCEELREIIEEMPGELQEIIRLHYYENMSMIKIADALGLKPYTARAMRAKAVEKLARRYKEKEIKYNSGYENIRTRAMRGTGVKIFAETWTSATERAAIVH